MLPRQLGEPQVSSDQLAGYVLRARNSPRLHAMSATFSRIAAGQEGAPTTAVRLNPALLGHDRAALEYARVRARYAGHFNAHFVASVPYALEEQCRLGAGLLDYCRETSHAPSVYTLGDGAGVTARALAQASRGRITTLNCSPTVENLWQFEKNRPEGSYFFNGPFFELTQQRRRDLADGVFADGFDVIIEDTTFQMYGRERIEPIALAVSHLKSEGIFVLVEKLAQSSPDEFLRRERQKDDDFKRRYFPPEGIVRKRTSIVSTMNSQLVSLGELAEALSRFFSHVLVIWNSGNFYTLAASNCVERLSRFVNDLSPPAVPPAFMYERLPRPLSWPSSADEPDGSCRFRPARPSKEARVR